MVRAQMMQFKERNSKRKECPTMEFPQKGLRTSSTVAQAVKRLEQKYEGMQPIVDPVKQKFSQLISRKTIDKVRHNKSKPTVVKEEETRKEEKENINKNETDPGRTSEDTENQPPGGESSLKVDEDQSRQQPPKINNKKTIKPSLNIPNGRKTAIVVGKPEAKSRVTTPPPTNLFSSDVPESMSLLALATRALSMNPLDVDINENDSAFQEKTENLVNPTPAPVPPVEQALEKPKD